MNDQQFSGNKEKEPCYRVDVAITYASGNVHGAGLLLDVERAKVESVKGNIGSGTEVKISLEGKEVHKPYYGAGLKNTYLQLPADLAIQLCWAILGTYCGLQLKWKRAFLRQTSQG